MVLFIENKKHKKEPFLGSLQAFKLKIQNSLSILEKEPELMSLRFLKQCFGLFQLTNKAFARLVVELDWSLKKWEGSSIDEYLNYTLNMLDMLNLVSSCLNHLAQERLQLLHSLLSNSPSNAGKYLIKMKAKDVGRQLKQLDVKGVKEDGGRKNKKNSEKEKERVIHEALGVMKMISLWVFGVLLSGLSSDVEVYLEMRKMGSGFDDSLLRSLDLRVEKEMLRKKKEVKEVEDVNVASNWLLGALGTMKYGIYASELRSRLEVLEKFLHGLEKETSHLFGETLAWRNSLLDSFRIGIYSS